MATYSWHSVLSKARQNHEDCVKKSSSLGPVRELSSRAGRAGPVGEASEEAGKKKDSEAETESKTPEAKFSLAQRKWAHQGGCNSGNMAGYHYRELRHRRTARQR